MKRQAALSNSINEQMFQSTIPGVLMFLLFVLPLDGHFTPFTWAFVMKCIIREIF
jgi:hypothetical protein